MTWSIVTQINIDKYIIEHSKDCKDFSPIGEIDGDGTHNEERHYAYTHNNPSVGVNYYRIKLVDYDGKFSYSDIASVRYKDNGETIIYPNPATSEVTVEVSEPLEVLVTDTMGRVLHKQTVNKENNVVDLSGMPSGLLIFSLQNGHKVKVLKD